VPRYAMAPAPQTAATQSPRATWTRTATTAATQRSRCRGRAGWRKQRTRPTGGSGGPAGSQRRGGRTCAVLRLNYDVGCPPGPEEVGEAMKRRAVNRRRAWTSLHLFYITAGRVGKRAHTNIRFQFACRPKLDLL
jgi:hypothetical protein